LSINDDDVRAGMVIVRTELQGVKMAMQHAFNTQYIPGLKAAFDDAVQAELDKFSFRAVVAEETSKALQRLTREAVADAITAAFDSESIRQRVAEQVTEAISGLEGDVATAAVAVIKERITRRW